MTHLISAVAMRLRLGWCRTRDEDSGQGLVEYSLVIALVSLGAVVSLGFMSGRVNGLFSQAGNTLNSAAVSVPDGGGGAPWR